MLHNELKTHLNAHETVDKTDPRIVLRGALDSLHAEFLLAQAEFMERGREDAAQSLESAAALLLVLIRGDSDRGALARSTVCGMELEGLRDASYAAYHEYTPPVPPYRAGAVAARLNLLRTRVREAELAAALCCQMYPEDAYRAAQYALNRLSSGLYLLFIRAGAPGEQRHG